MPSLDGIMSRYIGRIVAFVLYPILLPTAGALAVWLQNVVGIDMNGPTLVGYVAAVITGLALLGYQWLRNNGAFETAVVELHHLYEAGRQQIESQPNAKLPNGPNTGAGQTSVDPAQPPGLLPGE